MALVAPQRVPGGHGPIGQHGQHTPVLGHLVDGPKQGLLPVVQLVQGLGSLVEEVVQQLWRHHRVVGGEVTPLGQLNVRQLRLNEVPVQILARGSAAINAPKGFRRTAQVKRCTHRRSAVGEVVVANSLLLKALKKEQRLVHLDPVGVHGDDEVSGIEVRAAVLVHELHQGEEDGAPGLSKVWVNSQSRDLGDLPFPSTDLREVKNALQWEAKDTVANHGQRANHFAIPLGAECGGGGKRVIQRGAQPRGMRLHETRRYVSIVEDLETSLQLFAGFSDLQREALVRGRIAIDESPKKAVPGLLRQQRQGLAQPQVQALAPARAAHRRHGLCLLRSSRTSA